jgi:endogenous inhibitor of DNA gyrase (YacG/DUF329 family)
MRRAKCALCGQDFVVSDGPDSFFPFCSGRCKNADLARWFREEYSVPVESERVVQDFARDTEGPGEDEPQNR